MIFCANGLSMTTNMALITVRGGKTSCDRIKIGDDHVGVRYIIQC